MDATKPTGVFVNEEECDWIAKHIQVIRSITVVPPSTKMAFLQRSSNLLNIMKVRFKWIRLEETVQTLAKRKYNLAALPKNSSLLC